MSEDVISEEDPEDVYADFIDEESQRVKEVSCRCTAICHHDRSQDCYVATVSS